MKHNLVAEAPQVEVNEVTNADIEAAMPEQKIQPLACPEQFEPEKAQAQDFNTEIKR